MTIPLYWYCGMTIPLYWYCCMAIPLRFLKIRLHDCRTHAHKQKTFVNGDSLVPSKRLYQATTDHGFTFQQAFKFKMYPIVSCAALRLVSRAFICVYLDHDGHKTVRKVQFFWKIPINISTASFETSVSGSELR
jgi:hypothetical protein